MLERDWDEFCELVDATYDLIGSGANKVISGTAKGLFFGLLSKYSLEEVRAALAAHCADPTRGRFPPKPADVIEQLEGMAAKDGRPSGDEAWAIALTSQDEADTVVWTQEIAEAFAICASVLPDKVGARKAFLDAYERLVAAARSSRTPASWSASLGWDLRKRESALTKASTSGLLAAPVVAALLPPPVSTDSQDHCAQDQINEIREMLSEMNERKALEREQAIQRERAETAGAKLREQAKYERHVATQRH